MKGENVPNFKINTDTSSNVFQILQDLCLKQYEVQYHSSTVPSTVPNQHKKQFHLSTTPTTMQKQYKEPYPFSTIPSTASHPYEGQYRSSTMHANLGKASIMVQYTAQMTTSFRTTTPSTATTGRTTTKQVNPVHIHPETPCQALLEHCMHVHQPTVQVCKLG